jgi:hypothetical protein
MIGTLWQGRRNNAMKKSLQVLALMAVGLALLSTTAAASCRPATS